MARKPANAAAPSPDNNGTAGDQAAEALAQAAAEAAAQAVAESEVKSKAAPWILIDVKDFPVTLVLTNASSSRRDCHAIGLHMMPGEQCEFEFTETTFEKFGSYITQIAVLNAWSAGEGVLIEFGGGNAKN